MFIMKNQPTPDDRSTEEDELPVPMLIPLHKKHYVIALILVLALCVVLLSVILALSTHRATPELPPDSGSSADATPDLSPSSPPSEPEITPPSPSEPQKEVPTPSDPTADHAPTPTPIPTPTPTTPESTEQSTPTTELPPIVIEQVLLSGSAGLVYRSYGNGSCMVEGIGSCTDACLIIPTRSPDGDTVIAVGQNAFASCEALQAVQIPATVKSIGKGAFADCGSLLFFAVAADNPAYCAQDGVLYSKDQSALLCYPSGRPCPEAIIPASVTYISAGAFSPRAGYSTIVFEGTLNAWRAIQIEDDNHALYTLPKRFGQ
jgi:hypothetical protein